MNWEKFAIWWTTESDCRQIGSHLSGKAPEYLREQYKDRYGRNGRGRLWCADGFPTTCCPDEDSQAWAAWDEKARTMGIETFSRAGIVIRREDIQIAQRFWGFITDEKLELLASCKG